MCPPLETTNLCNIDTYDDIDREINKTFGLKESEQALIDDLFEFTLSYFKGGENSIAGYPTQRAKQSPEAELSNYLKWFLRVLNATFGADSPVCATLFEESSA